MSGGASASAALLLAFSLAACTSDSVNPGETTDHPFDPLAGQVRQVEGAANDLPLDWRLEPRWQVGGANDGELLLVQLFAKDLATDAHGNLYVIDRTQNRVVVYDQSGRLTRTLGRKGMGPGELTAAVALDVSADGEVRVDDVEKRAVVVFAPDGGVLPEERPSPRLRSTRTLTNGARAGARYSARDTLSLLVVNDSSPTTLLTFVEPPSRDTPPVCGLTNYPAGPVFAPTLLWAVRGNRVVAATGAFRISVFDAGVLESELTRSTSTRRSTNDLARQHLGPGKTIQLFGMPPCTVPTDLVLSVAEIAETLPAYSALAIAPDDRIWATRYTVRGEAGIADIYHPERGYEGTVALGAVRPVMFLSGGEVVSLETDEDGVPVVAVYRVVR